VAPLRTDQKLPQSLRTLRLPLTSWLLLVAFITTAPSFAGAQQNDTASPDSIEQFTPVSAPVEPVPAPATEPDPAVVSPEPAASQPPIDAQPYSSDTLPAVDTDKNGRPAKPVKRAPESEISIQAMYSYGNWQIFAAGIWEHLYTAGVEYDRNSWGRFIGAQMDYSAEVLPLVLLKEPRILNEYGVRRSKPGDDIIIPGFAFSPIGLRMQWRHNKAFKPYFNVKGGAIGFTQKALSPYASYYDFTLSESIGFYLRMSQRWDMRFGLFGDFHFSNAYITAFNPGLDVMNSSLAVAYHLGK